MYRLHLYQLVFPASQANFFTMLQAAFVLGIYRRIFEMIVTIAEVCFLSNPSEAAMITEETIQEKAAFQIAMGIMQFLHSPSFNPQ